MNITEDFLLKNINNPDKLRPALFELTQYLGNRYEYEFDDVVYTDCVENALSKTNKFENKGKLRIFYMTIISCYLRQFFRSQMNKKYIIAKQKK